MPIARPDIMQIDIEPYIGSPSKGIMPRIVVAEAITTGRTRLTVAVITD